MPIWPTSEAASDAARSFLFRPRAWVRRIGDCILKEDRLQPSAFVTLFVRDSTEKREELAKHGHAGVQVQDLLNITLGVAAHASSLFVQTSSHTALNELSRLLRDRADAP
eukprot:3351214-Prymnesium_polylepis.1